MNLSEIGAFISQVGIPGSLLCFLIYTGRKDEERQREQQEELRKTIENNTKTVDKLAGLVKELAQLMKGA